MLVDPLAIFFRSDLQNEPPLQLDITRVEVELLPPLARIAITRIFINRTDGPIEALLTLPPAMPDEVVHGLTVTIGGVEYRAAAQPRRPAERAHDAATAQGRVSILHERLPNGVQLVSIAGVAPMTTVSVRIDSIRPLDRNGETLASLVIPLSADPRRLNRGLPDSDRLLTTPGKHPATLTVTARGLNVSLVGRDGVLASGQSTVIDCAEPVTLGVAAGDGANLAHTADRIGEPGGWEAEIEAPLESMAGGLEPATGVSDRVNDRRDWIAGRTSSAIRVIAPSPMGDAGDLTPNARAMAAFAAAHLVDSAAPVVPAELRMAANILERTTGLAFIGPEGDASGEMPRLRKVALPSLPGSPVAYAPAAPGVAPLYSDDPVGPPRPILPRKPGDEVTPGGWRAPTARPPAYRWLSLGVHLLAWAPAAFVVLWVLASTVWAPFPMEPVAVGYGVAVLANAALHFPYGSEPDRLQARRRLPMLLILALPLLASWLAGPFGLLPDDIDALTTSRAIQFQFGCLLASLLLPLALLRPMRGARRFTLDMGGLGFLPTFLSVAVAIITLSPGD